MGFSLFRIAINVGGALGPLIATALASVDWSYVFWFNALCSLAYAAIAAARLPDDRAATTARRTRAEQTGEAASWGAILADGRFLAFLAAMLISVMVYAQLYATVPIAIEARGLPLTTYSTVLVVYSLVLICLELKVSSITRRYAPWIPGTLGTLILCAAIASFGLTLTSPVALVLSALALVCGLMISGPTMFAYPARFPLAIRGRAISLTQVAFSVGNALGPIVGVAVLDRGGSLVWGLCLLAGIVSAGLAALGMRPRAAAREEAPVQAAEEPAASTAT
jgi:predicted MFS family arabinose efflux permease